MIDKRQFFCSEEYLGITSAVGTILEVSTTRSDNIDKFNQESESCIISEHASTFTT